MTNCVPKGIMITNVISMKVANHMGNSEFTCDLSDYTAQNNNGNIHQRTMTDFVSKKSVILH